MNDRLAVVALSGVLDISRYPEVRAAFAAVHPAASSVLVDLSGATHVDSIFLTELLLFAKRLSAVGTRFGVLVKTPNVARTFALTNMAKSISFFTDLDEARKSLLPSNSIENISQ